MAKLTVYGITFRNQSDLSKTLGYSRPLAISDINETYHGSWEYLVKARLKAIDDDDAARKLKQLVDEKRFKNDTASYDRNALQMAAINFIKAAVNVKNDDTSKLMEYSILTSGERLDPEAVLKVANEMLTHL